MSQIENLVQMTIELILEDALSKDEALKMVYGYEEFLNSGLSKKELYDEVTKAWIKFQ